MKHVIKKNAKPDVPATVEEVAAESSLSPEQMSQFLKLAAAEKSAQERLERCKQRIAQVMKEERCAFVIVEISQCIPGERPETKTDLQIRVIPDKAD